MGAFQDERAAIEGRMQANFSALPVRYANVDFKQPKDAPWVAFDILTGRGEQVSLNSRPLNRYAGVIQATIHVPEETGTAVARGHADSIEAVFRNRQFSAGASGSIVTRTPYVTDLGLLDGWYRLAVSVNYRRDKTF